MKKNTTKPSTIIFLILLSTSIFANKTPNYPKGFSPKTNSGISFTENKGQIHDQNYKSRPDVLFGGSDGNLVFHLKNNGISYQLNRVDTWKKESDLIKNHADAKIQKDEEKLVPDQTTIYRLDINWLNANTNAELIKQNPLDGFNNYYLENCPNGALNVKSYQQITYQNIYDGIDLKWYEKDGRLEYDYLVSAGSDYKQIQLEIKGADKITLNNKGELIYKTPLGDIIEQAPLVKQNGKTLKSKWLIKNNVLSFEIEGLNTSEAFIIDPIVRLWGTYYGGSGFQNANSCATDALGNVYMAGRTDTPSSTSIATSGSHQSSFGGNTDAFLVKFNSAGVRQWGTYYGGSGNATAFSCATDANGNVYMAGWAFEWSGTSIATAGSHQPNYGGGSNWDAFLVKFNSAGIRQWGTYYGGIDNEIANSCATDANGNVYMVGYTETPSGTSIATLGSHQSANGGGSYEAFLVKFNSAGIRQWGTYYGGSGDDVGNSCATDASGNVYMAGWTDTPSGSSIANVGSHQSTFGGSIDAFLVKFNSAGIRQWGTYYGGNGYEEESDDGMIGPHGVSCATDASGNVYMAGWTDTPSGSSIATLGSHQSAYSGGDDGFLVKFNTAGVRLWGTYYGGNGADPGYSCATDAFGNVYMAGYTYSSSNIATLGSHQSALGAIDAFLVKFIDCVSPPTISVNSGAICAGQSFTINPTGANTYTIQGGSAVVSPSISTTYTVIGKSTAGCVSPAFATSSLIVNPNPIITVNSGSICAGQNFIINPNGANTYTILGAVVSPTGNTSYTVAGTSTAVVSPSINNTYTVIGTNTLTGCVSQGFATSSLTVNECVGITNQTMGIGGVTIYPNPTNGEFIIESQLALDLLIINELGQTIKNIQLSSANNLQVKVSDLANGIYFIVGKNKTTNINQKIIVNK